MVDHEGAATAICGRSPGPRGNAWLEASSRLSSIPVRYFLKNETMQAFIATAERRLVSFGELSQAAQSAKVRWDVKGSLASRTH